MLTLPLKTSRTGALAGVDRCTDERTDSWTPLSCHAQADATIRLYKTNTESENFVQYGLFFENVSSKEDIFKNDDDND